MGLMEAASCTRAQTCIARGEASEFEDRESEQSPESGRCWEIRRLLRR